MQCTLDSPHQDMNGGRGRSRSGAVMIIPTGSDDHPVSHSTAERIMDGRKLPALGDYLSVLDDKETFAKLKGRWWLVRGRLGRSAAGYNMIDKTLVSVPREAYWDLSMQKRAYVHYVGPGHLIIRFCEDDSDYRLMLIQDSGLVGHVAFVEHQTAAELRR